jgi:Zn finger protein HypA/HybF involved in hydrogenase expression
VHAVRVRAGDDLRVVGPALDQAFTLVAAGTVAEGALVDLIPVDGDELILESIEVESCA